MVISIVISLRFGQYVGLTINLELPTQLLQVDFSYIYVLKKKKKPKGTNIHCKIKDYKDFQPLFPDRAISRQLKLSVPFSLNASESVLKEAASLSLTPLGNVRPISSNLNFVELECSFC